MRAVCLCLVSSLRTSLDTTSLFADAKTSGRCFRAHELYLYYTVLDVVCAVILMEGWKHVQMFKSSTLLVNTDHTHSTSSAIVSRALPVDGNPTESTPKPCASATTCDWLSTLTRGLCSWSCPWVSTCVERELLPDALLFDASRFG